MNNEQFEKFRFGRGFVAALDQSGGSTPGALASYGIPQGSYADDKEMFDLVHEMRSRLIRSPGFDGDHILAAILFENTMDREIGGTGTAEYLWGSKRIVPFLKIDRGLAPEAHGVQMMKPIPDLDPLLGRAHLHNVLGTKMRSFIKLPDQSGVEDIVAQQFELALKILAADLLPIIEPEIDIHSPDKAKAESLLKTAIAEALDLLSPGQGIVLKLTLPEQDNLYADLVDDPRVVRVLALSGGYSRSEAVARLSRNHGVIASFARALTEGLTAQQSDQDFDATLAGAVEQVARASAT